MIELTPGAPVAEGVRAVADSQLADALHALDASTSGDPAARHEAVHAVRKRCKVLRALVRLVRDAVPGTYDAVNTALRDAARLVSASRDAGAAVETHDALVEAFGEEALAPWAPVRAALVERRDGEVLDALGVQLPEVHARLTVVRGQVPGWELPTGDATDVLRQGYARTYGRAVDRWRDATRDPSSHVWHQWRKRVKYHRHQVELLQRAWPPVMLHREELLHDLSDVLGVDHDLAELRATVVAGALTLDEDLLAGYLGLVDAHRARLQHRALPLGARLFVEPPDRHCDRVFTWWRLAADEAEEAARTASDAPIAAPVIPPGD